MGMCYTCPFIFFGHPYHETTDESVAPCRGGVPFLWAQKRRPIGGKLKIPICIFDFRCYKEHLRAILNPSQATSALKLSIFLF